MARKQRLDFPALCAAIHQSRLTLKRFRSERREMVRQYVGNHWSDEGAREPVPVNLLQLYVNVVGRNLISKTPRALLSTFNRQAKPVVSAMQDWLNEELVRGGFVRTENRVVLDGLFSLGIGKVALAAPPDAAAASWGLKAGWPFFDRVDLDDFVYDTHCTDFAEADFIGHRYRVPLDAVRDSKMYSKARKNVTASDDPAYNESGDERVKRLGQGYFGPRDEFQPKADLWEIYLPRYRLVLTLAGDAVGLGESDEDDDVLDQKRWLGPDCGPYHMLAYGTVPGNAMPCAPLQSLLDLHLNANAAYDKALRTLANLKENTTYRAGEDRDAEAIRTAKHLDMLGLQDPQAAQSLITGGKSLQPVFGFATELRNLFDVMGGNLSVLGGLDPGAKTAHQTALLNQNSSRMIVDMQEATVAHAESVFRAMLWFYHHHPAADMPTEFSVPGMGAGIPRVVTPQQRRGIPFEEIGLKVDPYSLGHDTPQSRFQSTVTFLQQVYVPLAALAAQQGVMLDMNKMFAFGSQFLDNPELADMLSVQEPPAAGGAPGAGHDDGTKMPTSTNREYTRHNVSERSARGHDQDMAARMMGQDLGGDAAKSMAGAVE